MQTYNSSFLDLHLTPTPSHPSRSPQDTELSSLCIQQGPISNLFYTWQCICFPGGSEVKASACNAGDLDSIPGSGRSPGEGNGNPLQYSCLENPMDRGAWWATVHRVTKSRTRLSNFTHSLCVYVSVPISQFIPLPLPPPCSHLCFLHLCLYSCPANRFSYTIFLDSTCSINIQYLLFSF